MTTSQPVDAAPAPSEPSAEISRTLAETATSWVSDGQRAILRRWMDSSVVAKIPGGEWGADSRLPWFDFVDLDGRHWRWRVTQVRPNGVCGYVAPVEGWTTEEGGAPRIGREPRGIRNWRLDERGRVHRGAGWQRVPPPTTTTTEGSAA